MRKANIEKMYSGCETVCYGNPGSQKSLPELKKSTATETVLHGGAERLRVSGKLNISLALHGMFGGRTTNRYAALPIRHPGACRCLHFLVR